MKKSINVIVIFGVISIVTLILAISRPPSLPDGVTHDCPSGTELKVWKGQTRVFKSGRAVHATCVDEKFGKYSGPYAAYDDQGHLLQEGQYEIVPTRLEHWTRELINDNPDIVQMDDGQVFKYKSVFVGDFTVYHQWDDITPSRHMFMSGETYSPEGKLLTNWTKYENGQIAILEMYYNDLVVDDFYNPGGRLTSRRTGKVVSWQNQLPDRQEDCRLENYSWFHLDQEGRPLKMASWVNKLPTCDDIQSL